MMASQSSALPSFHLNISTRFIMKTLFSIALLSLLLTACTSSANNAEKNNLQNQVNTNQQQQETPRQVKEKAQGIWIDVRSADEHNAGHLQNSLNIPVDVIAEKIAQVEPHKDAPINLYCRSGRRAETARQTLMNMGYTNVVNHGGYEDLIKQGYK